MQRRNPTDSKVVPPVVVHQNAKNSSRWLDSVQSLATSPNRIAYAVQGDDVQ